MATDPLLASLMVNRIRPLCNTIARLKYQIEALEADYGEYGFDALIASNGPNDPVVDGM